MQRLVAWFVDNPVAANLLMFLLVVGGVIVLPGLQKEEFPDIQIDVITVTVPYRGAAPAEVESGVCIRIEEAVDSIEGINKISTVAAEGACNVSIQLERTANRTKALDDITAQVNAITTFPVDTERPIIAEATVTALVMQLAISGQTDERSLKEIAENIRDELQEIPGISKVDPIYTRNYEISVEVSEHTLRQHGLTLSTVADAIRDASVDVPGGTLRTAGGEIMLRTKGQMYTGREFEQIPVITRQDGTVVTVGDLGTVVDGFEVSDMSAVFDGDPAVLLKIFRVGRQDVLDIADKTRAYVETKQQQLPEGISLSFWRDESDDLVSRLDALLNNAAGGLLLVVFTLSLFLRTRLALWVSAGIPISILGALAMFPTAGLTINTLSLMGFLLALGILVDDAIVVGERIYAHEADADDLRTAAIRGTAEVSIPVFFGVLTTMAAFIPIVSIDTNMGEFFNSVGFTVIICLVFSLIESLLILPSHLAHRSVRVKTAAELSRWERLQDTLSARLQHFANHVYQPALARVIRWRYVALAVGLGMLILTGGMIAGGRIVFQFFPPVEGDEVFVKLVLPEGTPIEVTEAAVERIRAAGDAVRERLNEDSPAGIDAVRHVLVSVGAQVGRGAMELSSQGGANFAEVSLAMLPHEERGGLFPSEVADLWRELTGVIPDTTELSFTAQAFSMGKDIALDLRGRDVTQLGAAAAEVRGVLGRYEGVQNITDSFMSGKQEMVLKIRPEAELLGLTQAALGRQVRQAFYGEEAQRVQRGREDVRVMVRFPEQERISIGDFENMRIRLDDGTEVPVLSVADVHLGRGNSTIQRVNGQRVISVTADVDRHQISPEVVIGALFDRELPAILKRYPGVSIALSGEAEERVDAMHSIQTTSVIALLVIFALLAIPLKSYLQPLVIMSSIPFGMVGALIGHWIMGYDLVFFSLLGIVALSGVVVNSSLVMVDYTNRRRREGVSMVQSVLESGTVRFRPIMLTSVTTFIGLVPLMLTADVQTGMFVPMAISLGFGVIFATVVTLLLIPALYVVLEDFLGVAQRLTRQKVVAEAADEQVELLAEVGSRR